MVQVAIDPTKLAEQTLVETRINAGQQSNLDPVDIPNGALTLARNIRIKLDRAGRRAGNTQIVPARPDNLSVTGLFVYKRASDQKSFLIRVASNGVGTSSIHYETLGAWVPFVGGLPGTLAKNDKAELVVFNDRAVMSFNGKSKIKEIVVGADTIADLSADAPTAKYIAGFYNRIVAATDTEVYWSGDGNITVWDPLVDESAGFSPIVESPSDQSDYITGIFALTNVMIMMREQSIWTATKQPIAQNPFYFATALPGLGSNCPSAIVLSPHGLIFPDTKTGSVYVWDFKNAPEPIGKLVENTIFKNLDDPSFIVGDYYSQYGVRQYAMGVPQIGSSTVRFWIYHFDTQAWVYDEIENCEPTIDSVVYSPASSVNTIDNLAGTIDSLTGTIDALGSGSAPAVQARLIGKTNGDIIAEDLASTTDDGTSFISEIATKDFTAPTSDSYFSSFWARLEIRSPGSITVSYSKDGGVTWIVRKVITGLNVSKDHLLKTKKLIKCRKIRWKLSSTDCLFDVLEYVVKVMPGVESSK